MQVNSALVYPLTGGLFKFTVPVEVPFTLTLAGFTVIDTLGNVEVAVAVGVAVVVGVEVGVNVAGVGV